MEGSGLVLALIFVLSAGVGLVVYEALRRQGGGSPSDASVMARNLPNQGEFGGSEGARTAPRNGDRPKFGIWLPLKRSEKFRAAFSSVVQGIERILPMAHADAEVYQVLLQRAGWSIEPATWRGARVVLSATCGLLAGVLLLLLFHVVSLQLCGLVGVAAVIGWMVSRLILERSIVKRRRALEAQLPDAMELLGITMAAGSPVEQSFREVAENLEQPLAAEFGIVDREVNLLGHSREQALDNLARRCASRDLSSFVAQLSQAVSQGSSIAEGLSSQATLARETAQAAIIERIRKMPTKLDIVLSFCFLPPTVALVVVPTVIDLLSFLNDTLQ